MHCDVVFYSEDEAVINTDFEKETLLRAVTKLYRSILAVSRYTVFIFLIFVLNSYIFSLLIPPCLSLWSFSICTLEKRVITSAIKKNYLCSIRLGQITLHRYSNNTKLI